VLRWLREVVDYLQPEPLFRTDAPSWVDISLRRKDDSLLIHLVNGNPGRDVAKLGSDDLWVDEIPIIGPDYLSYPLRKTGSGNAGTGWRDGRMVVDGWNVDGDATNA